MNTKIKNIDLKLLTAVFLLTSMCCSCAFRSIKRSKGIKYLEASPTKNIATQKINVFAPRKHTIPKNVLIFIHGGNWNSGKRSLYNFFGTRMARKGIVTVIIDYPLTPKATYKEMAYASAASVKWVKENIAAYGGDTGKIFVSGHSAGGHLAALISLDNEYFDSLKITNPLKNTDRRRRTRHVQLFKS